MNQKSPFIIPYNEPACYVTPKVMKEFDDELDEAHWVNLASNVEKLHKPKGKFE